jgi:hypothetical protein
VEGIVAEEVTGTDDLTNHDIIGLYALITTATLSQLQGALSILARSAAKGHINIHLTGFLPEADNDIRDIAEGLGVVIRACGTSVVSVPFHLGGRVLNQLDRALDCFDELSTRCIVYTRDTTLSTATKSFEKLATTCAEMSEQALTFADVLNTVSADLISVCARSGGVGGGVDGAATTQESLLHSTKHHLTKLFTLINNCRRAAFALTEYEKITRQ